MPRPARLLVLLALIPFLAAPAAAQTPKPGDWYEDSNDLGFKLRLPKDWDFLPAEPGEPNVVGRCDAGTARTILAVDPRGGHSWRYQMWIVKFDRRPQSKLDANGKPLRKGAKDLPEWIEKNGLETVMHNWREDEEERKTGKVGKLDVTEYEFTETMGEDTEVRVYAMVYQLLPEVDLAVVYNGPGEKKWSKHKTAARSLARTLKPIEIETFEVDMGAGTLRDRKRAQLMQEVARSKEWELYETPNYFLISNNDDKQFIDEALERLEAIRKVYAELYPPELAERLRERARAARAEAEAAARAAGEPDGGAGGDGGAEAEEGEPATVVLDEDPMERARTSVARICGSREQYQAYGGPPGTGGYWSSGTEELVFFDDKEVLGRDSTWNTLNHEAFHQYIYYFFGKLAPHSWYNEGHGDFFGAYEYEHKRFKLTRSPERIRDVQEMVRAEKHVPLRDLVRWSQSQYYGNNSLGTVGWQNYAQGWSLIYFLRTGKKQARGWNPAWDSILDTYLATLVETDDLDLALERAFAGVDWRELEDCWKAYTLE